MVRAESLVSLRRAVVLASRALSGQVAGARPALAAAHQALQTAAATLSADTGHSGSLLARHGHWRGVPPVTHLKPAWHFGGRGYSSVPATAMAPDEAGLMVTDKAIQRLQELANASPGEATVLRLTVEGGGCSGYTYNFTLEGDMRPDDRVVEEGGVQLVCDPVSYEFVRGATVDYTTDIIRSAFEVVTNPNAQASCGCGSSFAPKD